MGAWGPGDGKPRSFRDFSVGKINDDHAGFFASAT